MKSRETLSLGSSANDGTGDSLRAGGQKINTNIGNIFQEIGGDSDQLPGKIVNHNAIVIDSDQTLSIAYSYYILNKGSALALSLPDGTHLGEEKTFTNKGAGTATITPTSFAQGTSFALAQYDGCKIIWDSDNWYLIGNQGELTIA